MIQGTDLDATQAGAEFLSGVHDDRFFLYLHYMDVHQYTYSDTAPVYGSLFSDIYDSSLHWVDQNVGVVVDQLRADGLLDNTVIVIASDHGEAFFEHEGEGHARNLYWEVQDVPLIIAPPVAIQGGIVVSEPVANIDIWPTVLDLVGLPPLPDAEGQSLMPLILAAAGLGEVPPELKGRALIAQLDRSWGQTAGSSDEIISLRQEPYRFIMSRERPEETELFDHGADPGEQSDLSQVDSEVAAGFAEDVANFLAEPSQDWENPEVEIDEMMRAQLRALGYALPPSDPMEAARRKAEAERVRPGGRWDK